MTGTGCGGGGSNASYAVNEQSKVVYYLYDQRGSVTALADSAGTVVYERSDYPYGLERQANDKTKAEVKAEVKAEGSPQSKPDFESQSVLVDYVHTGKEYDAETGLIYFGGRHYSPVLARWITPDPLYLEMEPDKTVATPMGGNLYAYSFNNPMRFVDLFGFDPGDLFATVDEAAVDAIHFINPTSVDEGKEYGGWIYRDRSSDQFTYKRPTQGTKDTIPNFPAQPSFTAAWYHTHGDDDPKYDNENFSTDDMDVSNDSNRKGYLGTPRDAIKMYDPKTKTVEIVKSFRNVEQIQ